MKKTYRGTCLIRATPKGINVWIPKEAIEAANAMPDEPTNTIVRAKNPEDAR